MIISKKHKYVFISTPKTGSHTFFKMLPEQFDGERQQGAFHRRDLPSGIVGQGYTVFSTVRNPYDRLVALWNSLLHTKPDPHAYRDTWLSVIRHDDFATFVKFAANNHKRIETMNALRMPNLMMPQNRWYKAMPADVIPLHLENLSEEFHALPFVTEPVTIPHELKRDHATWDDLKTDEVTEYANEWAGEDFERFGYTRE